MTTLEELAKQKNEEIETPKTPEEENTQISTTTEILEPTNPEHVISNSSDADVQVTPIDIWEKLGAQPLDEAITWLKGLIYGEPGAGKTYLGGSAGTSELTSPGLILDIDGGVTSIRHFPNLKVRQVRSMDDLIQVYSDIHSAIDTIDPSNPTLPFKFLMLDSITELQKIDMTFIMSKTKAVLEGRQDPDVPSEREWGISINHMRKIVRQFKDLPCHVLFTAHLDPKKNTKNQMVNGPDLPGKLRNQISGFVDVVGYLYAATEDDRIVRKIQFAKTDTTIAKDRLGVLGQVVVNPTFPMLVEKLHPTEVTA
jgi:phage nucleotide-binding protein